MSHEHAHLDLTRELDSGLVLRRASEEDVSALAEFYARVFAPPKLERLDSIKPYVRDLASGRHPTTRVQDFLLVEDRAAERKIVSAVVLIPQDWEMDGVLFGVGRVELVATDKAYRRRGLVRALFGAAHELSSSYGHLVQAVTGIFTFYRQFGYEYALDLDGSRSTPAVLVPDLKPGEGEPYSLRPAVPEDLPQIARLYDRQRAGRLVSAPKPEGWLRWTIFGQTRGSTDHFVALMIVDGSGRALGYLLTMSQVEEDPHLPVFEVAVDADVSLREVMPSTLRGLKAYAANMRTLEPEPRPIDRITFECFRDHAVYQAVPDLLPLTRPPYAWYVRVPDVPRFLRRIAPVLERRLAASVVSGYTGDLKLSFFRDGVRLHFESGRLSEAVAWTEQEDDRPNASFPPLVFLQMLFGRHSYDELHYVFPDVYCREAALPLVAALFPKQMSWVVPLP